MTLLQFTESLSDRRAADAVRGHIDWKNVLGVELTHPGFDASVLSEFCGRLVAGGAEEHLLNNLLGLCRDLKLLSAQGRQCTDSTHVLGVVCSFNRLECVTKTLRADLNALAPVAPTRLQHVLTATAMNLVRIGAWIGGTPLAQTRQSALTKLMMAPTPR